MGFNSSKKTGLKGSGSTKTETQKDTQESLNLIKKLEDDLAKAQARLQANLGHIGAERDIRAEILDIEKQIYYYRTGKTNDTKFSMPDPVQELMRLNGLLSPVAVGKNPRAGNDPRQDMDSDMLKPIELTFDNIKSVTDDMLGSFQ